MFDIEQSSASSDDISSDSSDEDVLAIARVIQQRHFENRFNPMEAYGESDFRKRFRLSKRAVGVLEELLVDHIKPATQRNKSLSAMTQILICLRFLSTGSFQIMVGDYIKIDQATVSRVLSKVLLHIAHLRPQYVKMPSAAEEVARTKSQFQAIAGFPGVIGCIDGTHIPIQSPGGDVGELYRNRKSFFSYNVQVVCDSELKITDIVARWPGSTHDSTVFNNSLLKYNFETSIFPNSWLLGDSAYACGKYMLTPVGNPNTPAEIRYNAAQIKTRNTVERTIGVWKRRFASMARKLRLKKETTLIAIVATAVLHNMCIMIDGSYEEEEDGVLHNVAEEVVAVQDVAGVAVRNRVIQQYFN